MGDAGKLYIPVRRALLQRACARTHFAPRVPPPAQPELVSIYRDEIVPLATMLTPNQFEIECVVRLTVAPCAPA